MGHLCLQTARADLLSGKKGNWSFFRLLFSLVLLSWLSLSLVQVVMLDVHSGGPGEEGKWEDEPVGWR
jgi:hypothetical protein